MKDSGPSVPPWAVLAPAAAPPVLTFDEPTFELLSRSDSHNSSNPRSNPQLSQPTGEICSPEGQWNCMTTSWQRCASGMWSAAIPCATGTICQPFGLTDFITIEHQVSVEGGTQDNGHASDGKAGDDHGDDREKSGKKSLGLRNSPGLALLAGTLLTGVCLEFLV